MSAIENELDDYLAEAEKPEGYEPEAGPWLPQDDAAADWCLRKLAKAEQQAHELDLLVNDRIEHLRAWYHERHVPLDNEIAHWRAILEDYALRRRERTGAKSVSLPNGELLTRTLNKGGAVEIADKSELRRWLEQRPDREHAWCKIEPEPQVSKIRTEVEMVDGSVCRFCAYPIVRRQPADPVLIDLPAVWVSAAGAVCNATPADGSLRASAEHLPAMVDGEELECKVVVFEDALLGKIPVPGLAVKAETVKAEVKVNG